MPLQDSRRTGRLRLRHLKETTEARGEEMAEERSRFHRLAREDSAPKVFSSFNLFPTPPALAAQLIERADIRPGHKVLEPSAGTGNLLRAIAERFDTPQAKHIEVTAVEIDGPLWNHLSDSEFAMFTNARLADFLTWEAPHLFDRIVMNPPFKMGADIKHIRRAMTMLSEGGRLVALCAAGPKQVAQLQPLASEWIDLPSGSFREAGTNVCAAMMVFDKE